MSIETFLPLEIRPRVWLGRNRDESYLATTYQRRWSVRALREHLPAYRYDSFYFFETISIRPASSRSNSNLWT